GMALATTKSQRPFLSRWTGVRYHAHLGVADAATLPGSGRPGAGTESGPISPIHAATRRWLAYLPWRAVRDQYLREGLFCAQAVGHPGRGTLHGQSPGGDSRERRGGEGQCLHQDRAGALRSVRLARHSLHAPRDHAPAEALLFQHLRHIILVANGAGATTDHVRTPAGLPRSPRAG